MIYNSLFISQSSYCHLVWGTTTKSNLHKIYLPQKIMLRIIYNVFYRHPSAELYERSKLTTINNLYNLKLCISYKQQIGQHSKFLFKLASFKTIISVYSGSTTGRWTASVCEIMHEMEMLRQTHPVSLNNSFEKNMDIANASLKYI